MTANVWFTAGLLFGERVGDEAVIKNHNDRVDPRDLVWILGNAATSMTALSQVERLNGRKYLICGPRDPLFAAHYPGGKGLPEAARLGMKAVPSLLGVITGRAYPRDRLPIRCYLGFGIGTVDLWHFAWQVGAARGDDLYADYRRPPTSKETRWQLCGDRPGHVRSIPERRLVNVTVEAWGRPVHADEVREIIQKG